MHRTSEWPAFLTPDPTCELPGAQQNYAEKDEFPPAKNLLVYGGPIRQTHLTATRHNTYPEKNTEEADLVFE